MEATKRVKIVTGFHCNAKCTFCYYGERVSSPNFAKESIRGDILFALRNGIREIDFSGGEPTTHPDLAELISFAKAKGAGRACIITNGIIASDKKYLRSLVDAGLDEALFSLQGHDAASHDSFVGVSGSFSKIRQAMENAMGSGLRVRINSVIHRHNYRNALDIAKVASQFSPVQFNFISINDWQNAARIFGDFTLLYSDLAPYIMESCDYLKDHTDNINIRYAPFCLFPGYEKYICGHSEVRFDPFEWDPYVRSRLEKHYFPFAWMFMVAAGALFWPKYGKAYVGSRKEFLGECIVRAIKEYGYAKSPACGKCRYYYICDAVERKYAKRFGFGELKAVEGARIAEPFFFRRHIKV
ncbi:MAG: radical SAM protein [Candidatus Omnitrophota bacterium]